jgi:GDSL-like Lipase/Acylhydrolase family
MLNGLTRFFRYQPNSEGMVYGHPFRVNRWGVRGSDFLERTQVGPEPFRIMVLGDSITAGFGVAEEDRYTNILERRLRERYPSRNIEVINVGVQGFETLQEVKMLRQMWSAVEPNLTVVGVSNEDSNITYDYYLPYKIPIPERVRPYFSHLLTFRVIEMPYDWLYRKMHHIPFQVDHEKRSLDLESRDWKVFEQSVQDISNFVMAHTHEPPLAVYLFDTMAGKERGYDQIRHTFLKNGFIWSEVLGNGYEPVSRFEDHPNERSHQKYADALFNTIVGKHLISEPPSQIVSK